MLFFNFIDFNQFFRWKKNLISINPLRSILRSFCNLNYNKFIKTYYFFSWCLQYSLDVFIILCSFILIIFFFNLKYICTFKYFFLVWDAFSNCKPLSSILNIFLWSLYIILYFLITNNFLKQLIQHKLEESIKY